MCIGVIQNKGTEGWNSKVFRFCSFLIHSEKKTLLFEASHMSFNHLQMNPFGFEKVSCARQKIELFLNEIAERIENFASTCPGYRHDFNIAHVSFFPFL